MSAAPSAPPNQQCRLALETDAPGDPTTTAARSRVPERSPAQRMHRTAINRPAWFALEALAGPPEQSGHPAENQKRPDQSPLFWPDTHVPKSTGLRQPASMAGPSSRFHDPCRTRPIPTSYTALHHQADQADPPRRSMSDLWNQLWQQLRTSDSSKTKS